MHRFYNMYYVMTHEWKVGECQKLFKYYNAYYCIQYLIHDHIQFKGLGCYLKYFIYDYYHCVSVVLSQWSIQGGGKTAKPPPQA